MHAFINLKYVYILWIIIIFNQHCVCVLVPCAFKETRHSFHNDGEHVPACITALQ